VAGGEAVDGVTLARVDGFDHRRRLEPVGHVPPADAEARYDECLEERARAA
jgi:hypothetical protein